LHSVALIVVVAVPDRSLLPCTGALRDPDHDGAARAGLTLDL
jgi:hypothetical protein